MAKGNLSVRLGNTVLTLEDYDQADDEFKKDFAAVSKTKPASIQEFFERLVQVQQNRTNKRSRSVRASDEKRGNKRIK